MKRTVRLIAALTVFTACVSCAGLPVEKSRIVENLIQERVDELGITGLTAAVRFHGKSIVSRGFGLREKSPDRLPVTEHTLFQIGSISKIFTALAVMQLAEDGDIDLDADIREYLPDFNPRSFDSGNRAVSVRSLLIHHSGLPSAYFRHFVQDELDPEEFMNTSRVLSEEYLVWDSGTVFAYNNAGFSLLGELVARVSGVSYESYITDRIFTPLGMDDSRVFLADRNDPKVSGGFSDGEPVEDLWFIKDIPAGAILLSAKDMDLFLKELLDCSSGKSDTILEPATLRSMFLRQNGDVRLDDSFEIGLTFWIESLRGHAAFGHGGTIPPFCSEMKIIPDEGIGIFLSSNDSPGDNDALTSLAEDIADILIGGEEPPENSHEIRNLADTEPTLPAGYYVIGGGVGLTSIVPHEGILTARIPEMGIDVPVLFRTDGTIAFGDSGILLKPADTEKADYFGYLDKYFLGPVTAVSREEVPQEWRKRLGRYVQGGNFVYAVDLAYNEDAGVLTLLVESETGGEMNLPLSVLSEDLLKVQGYGRNTGNVIEYQSSESGEILRYAGVDYAKEN